MTATSVRLSLAPRGVHLRRYRKRRVSDNFRPVAKLNIAWEQVIEEVTEERVRLWGPKKHLPPSPLRTPSESFMGWYLERLEFRQELHSGAPIRLGDSVIRRGAGAVHAREARFRRH